MPMQTDYPTAPSAAVEGQIACRLNDAQISSAYNAEASAKIGFGLGVIYGSATLEAAAKLPSAETDKVMGITCRTHSIDSGERGELDDTDGVKAGGQLNVLTEGTIWVKATTGCAPGEKLWVRCTATPGIVGSCGNADDGTETIDCTKEGTWLTYAAADGLAKLRVKF